VALHWSNIHGSPWRAACSSPSPRWTSPAPTNCVFGAHSYVQVGSCRTPTSSPAGSGSAPKAPSSSTTSSPGSARPLRAYEPGSCPSASCGLRGGPQRGLHPVYSTVNQSVSIPCPGASLSPYAVVKGETNIDENVLVCQRAYLAEHPWATRQRQENCYIVHSRLEATTSRPTREDHPRHCESNCFVGFNAFVHGTRSTLQIGKGCIVMRTPSSTRSSLWPIPRAPWSGLIQNAEDLKRHSVSLSRLRDFGRGRLRHHALFPAAAGLRGCVLQPHPHILEANGAYYDPATGQARATPRRQRHGLQHRPALPRRDKQGLYPTWKSAPRARTFRRRRLVRPGFPSWRPARSAGRGACRRPGARPHPNHALAPPGTYPRYGTSRRFVIRAIHRAHARGNRPPRGPGNGETPCIPHAAFTPPFWRPWPWPSWPPCRRRPRHTAPTSSPTPRVTRSAWRLPSAAASRS
jgi:hypothetical protein